MKITPLDIRRKEFKRSVRGYSDEEVDIFLDEVADEFERLFQENMELHDRMQRMDEQIAGHTQLKDALEKTLISAQLQAEELRANAHKESELILRDAEMKARGIVSDSYGETQKTQQTLVQLKLLEEDFRFKFRSLLEGYLRLLNQAPLASAGSEAATGSQAAAATPGAPPAAASAPESARPSAAMQAPPTSVAPAAPPTPAAGTAAGAQPAPRESEPVVPRTTPSHPPVMPDQVAEMNRAARPGYVAPTPPVMPSAPVAPPLPVTPVAPSAPAPTPPPPPFRPAPGVSPTEQAPTPVFDDDIPTQESTLGVSETALTQDPPTTDRPDDEEPLRRFFFGRQMSDADDTFQGEDAPKRDRNRDFEW